MCLIWEKSIPVYNGLVRQKLDKKLNNLSRECETFREFSTMTLVKSRLLIAGSVAVIFALSAIFLASRVIELDRALYVLPRQVIQLERALGYDGFIHNFKNGVLRQDENYFDKAENDYEEIVSALKRTGATARSVGLQADLASLEATLSDYRAMIDKARQLQQTGKSAVEVDTQIRLSDIDAAKNIRAFELQLINAMQGRRWLFVAVGVACFSAFVLTLLALTLTQVRLRHIAEKSRVKVRESEAALLQAERIARLGHWKVLKNGTLQTSKSMQEILSLSSSDAPDTLEKFFALLPDADKVMLESKISKSVHLRKPYTCFHKIKVAEGPDLFVANTGEPVIDDQGNIYGFVGVLQDISRTIDLESELRQSQKMEAVGNLAGGMAHDFNNILAVILGNLELMEIEEKAESHSGYRANAIQAAKRGAEITKNVLSFARKSHLDPKILDGNSVVREVLTWAERLLPANIEIQTSLLGSIWPFLADDALTKSALLNLLLNARDAMPDGGRLTIETANVRLDNEYLDDRNEHIKPGRYVMLAISDTGTGIEPQHLNEIFEPFFSTKQVGKGSGLGLSMVHGFMKQSGGAVRVYSELGSGTTFKLYFKATRQDSSFDALPVRKARSVRSDDAKILLVEDNAALLQPLEEILTEAGYTVTTARSGDEAFATWTALRDFDVVITDIVMPGQLQGTHLAREIREADPIVPFVFMSGYASEAMIHGNGLQPEDCRLMKPVGRSDLLAAIDSILEGGREKVTPG